MNRKRERVFGGSITTPFALFGEEEAASDPQRIAITHIRLPEQQPRRYFDPQKMEQLILSVKEHGILEPILVRVLKEFNAYELVAGERRYRAAKEVGLTEIPVVIRDLTDEQAVQIALVENLQREDLNPVEETEGVLHLIALKARMLVTDVPKLLYRMQHEAKGEIAHNVMGSRETEAVQAVFATLATMTWESFVNNRLPLLNLPQDILECLRQGKIAYTKAQAVARLKDEPQRKELLEKVITENLSLTQIKERIVSLKNAEESSENKTTSVENQINVVLRLVKRSKVWHDPKKQKRLEKLLADLKFLVSDAEQD